MRRNRAGDRVGQSRNSHIAKQLPKGRQWIGQVVHRKDAAWGKDWFPGKVTQWNEVTNKHHILYEKTVDWEEFDEWVNLDKAPSNALRWDGELPVEYLEEEASEAELETETFLAARAKAAAKGRKKAKTTTAGGAAPLSLEDKLGYIKEKLAFLQKEAGESASQPHATPDEVESFEKEHKITLPPAYRGFILQVANGGCGPPRTGLAKLGEAMPRYKLEQPFPFSAEELPVASSMYLGQRRVFTSDAFPGDSRQPEAKELDMVRKFKDEGWGGLLFLGADGDGDEHFLVVSGPDRGGVWMLAEDFFGPHELDFVDWYAQWLDRQQLGQPVVSGANMVILRS